MAISGVTDYTNTYAADRANGSSTLNVDSQAYLNSLKEKYPDVNITVADFKNGKQEDAYMLGSRGYNNIAVSSSIVEKMAKDPAAAAKYEKVLQKCLAIRSGLRSSQGRTMMRYSVQEPLLTRMGKCLTGWSAGARTQWRTPVRSIRKRYRNR